MNGFSKVCKHYPGSASLFSAKKESCIDTLGITKYVRVFAHNGSRFDYYPIITELGKYTGKDPEVVFDGGAILQIKTFDRRLIFMDSLHFLAMRLKDMPKTFGVEEVKKGFFPVQVEQPAILGQSRSTAY